MVRYSALGLMGIVAVSLVIVAIPATDIPASSSSARFIASTPPPITRSPVSAYVIGDSVTAGAGAGQKWQTFAAHTANYLNWSVEVDGAGGAGFTAKGAPSADGTQVDLSFNARLPELLEAQPDVVIVAGGRNDMYLPVEDVKIKVDDFYHALRQGLPNATIVTIAGWRWNVTSDLTWAEEQAAIADVLAIATERVGGIFIDPPLELTQIDDSNSSALLSEDGFHPNPAGYKQIGIDLARTLYKKGLPRGPERWRETEWQSGEYSDLLEDFFTEP